MSKKKTAISPTRAENYPDWYQSVVKASNIGESSSVRGCMVILPWGYGIWELIKNELDAKIKATGHENFYFPAFVPLKFMDKEAGHISGFATECAVVTHYKLVKNSDGQFVPDGKLEEPLVVRPTSEAIIGDAYSRWINSYRDLPLLGNQWANVVRWEMRPRIFLRTSEFLWQEGHTAHATADEALAESEQMLHIYKDLIEDYLAIPVLVGAKTESEKFPGADITYCLEAMMQDTKSLQAGTSHFLGQNFSRAFNIKYLSKEGRQEYVWTTSWGVTTRLIGALVMVHSDDDGLRLPPMVSPEQVVIIPILHKSANSNKILDYCGRIETLLKELGIRVKLDNKDYKSSYKVWDWVKKGVPIRLEIGMKELESGQVSMTSRLDNVGCRQSLELTEFLKMIERKLCEIQEQLYEQALSFMQDNTYFVESRVDFDSCFAKERAGFVKAFCNIDDTIEQELQHSFKVSARCILEDESRGTCIFTGTPDAPMIVFARSY